MSKSVIKKYKIADMHCSSCAVNIDLDLEDVEGVKSASTSYAKQICEVEFDLDKIDSRKIIAKIKKTGYTAEEIK